MELQVKRNMQITEVNLFVIDLRAVHNDLREVIEDAQCRYQKSADKKWTPAPRIEVGDHVFLLAKFIKST